MKLHHNNAVWGLGRKSFAVFTVLRLSTIFLIGFLLTLPTGIFAASKTWDFSASSDYEFDDSKIEVTSGIAQLKNNNFPAWYNTSWSRRKTITINNTGNGATLTNYQTKVVVSYDSDMQGDFDDIRFTSADGTTILNHWIESKTNSSTANFWVKVPSIAASANTDIYMYYGNASVSTTENGENTFRFFDDFSTTRASETPALTFGIFTSVEHGETNGRIKLQEAVNYYNNSNVSFVVENGDFIDYNDAQGGVTREQMLGYLDEAEAVYDDLSMPRYYALGNHDIDYITKQDFIDHTGKNEKYESFDAGNYHFIILDANYTSDSDSADGQGLYIPPAQRTWLQNDLASTSKKTIVIVEQQLTSLASCDPSYVIVNSAAVRTILENSGKVIGVMHGHCGLNSITTVNGIPYYSLRAMDLSATNAYSKVNIYSDNSVDIEGVGEQISYFNGINRYNTNKWDLDGTPVLAVADGKVSITSDVVSTWEGLVSKNFSLNNGVVEFKASSIGFESGVGIIKPAMSGGGSRYGALILPGSTGGNELRKYIAGTQTQFNADFPTFPFIGKVKWSGSVFYIDYNQTQQWTDSLVTTDLKVGIEASSVTPIILDYIFAREYTSTEPTTSAGSEVPLYSVDVPSIKPISLLAQSFKVAAGFSATEVLNGGSITYQVSNDGGTTWYWYNNGWVSTTAGASESNTLSTINGSVSTLPLGTSSFNFKAFLNSNGEQLVQLNDASFIYGDASSTSSGGGGSYLRTTNNTPSQEPVFIPKETEPTICTPKGISGIKSVKPGSTSKTDTKGVQQAINQMNILTIPLKEDGLFGPKTYNAIKLAQKKFKVSQDGAWGRNTQALYLKWVGSECK